MKRTSVLIVGGGPVGLGAAIELARHEIDVTVVEREVEPSHHPKARGFRIRTMELFRLWGIESSLRERALKDNSARFIYCDSLAGKEFGRNPDVLPLLEPFSPTGPCRIGQDVAEAALRTRIDREPGITSEFGVECVGLVDRGDEVIATLRDCSTGDEHEVAASYVIAADGIGSGIRSELGIEMQGKPLIAYWQSIYWRGEIDDLTAHRPCVQFLTNPDSGRFVTVAMVDRRRWVTLLMLPPTETRPPQPSADESVEIVRSAVGRADLEVDVIDVATWRLSAQVASSMRAGRIFLAGDAAHSLPPTGGFGMNTGLQDVHNLAWKLALVLRHGADEQLLASYDIERRAIAQANTAWSAGNAGAMSDIRTAIVEADGPRLAELLDRQRLHHAALPQDLGFHYDAGAIVRDNGAGPREELASDPAEFEPIAAPGYRAPHLWLGDGERRISTLDLFDRRFVLLTGPEGHAWLSAVDMIRGDLDVPIDAYAVGGAEAALRDPSGEFLDRYGIDSDGAVLVRPDGHVAWRSPSGEADHAERLRAVLLGLGIRPLPGN